MLPACGSSVALIDRMLSGTTAAARAYAEANIDRWLADLSPDDLRLRSGVIKGSAPYETAHDRLAPMLWRHAGLVELAELLPRTCIIDAVLGPWPSSFTSSASRFSTRLSTDPSPTWVDRYLLLHPIELADFLRHVATSLQHSATLSLLTTHKGTSRLTATDRAVLATAIADVGRAGLSVAVCVASGRDVSSLHARQLYRPLVQRSTCRLRTEF